MYIIVLCLFHCMLLYVSRLDYSSALEYSVIRHYTDIVYYYIYIYIYQCNLRVKISLLRIKLTHESQLFANQNQRYILMHQHIDMDAAILNTFAVFGIFSCMASERRAQH